jgi:hypothetical protein
MVNTRSKRFAIILAAAATVAVLLWVSYAHALARADALITRIPERWERVGSRFSIIGSVTGGPGGPSWEFDYDCPPNYFGVGYFTLRMSLLGQPLASNPHDFLAHLKSLP